MTIAILYLNRLRRDYIKALKVADRGDYSQLIQFMQICGARDLSLLKLLDDSNLHAFAVSKEGLAIVKALIRRKKQNKLKTKDLANLCDLKPVIVLLERA